MNEEKTAAEKGPAKYSVEWMLDIFGNWEHQHLSKLAPQMQQNEYGRVREALRTVGVQLDRRVSAVLANKCGACGKTLGDREIIDTIPMPFPESNTKPWVNLSACSMSCAEKLRAKAREKELYLTTH
jgi:hypothetical protein